MNAIRQSRIAPSMPSLHDVLLSITRHVIYEPTRRCATRESIERNAHKPCSKCKTAPRNLGKSGKPTSTMCAACEREYKIARRKSNTQNSYV